MENLSENEKLIFNAIIAGRNVQDFLWGENSLNKKPYKLNKKYWTSVFQKRVDKIDQINFDNPNYVVELKKRLLQQAALSIQAMEVLDKFLIFKKLDQDGRR